MSSVETSEMLLTEDDVAFLRMKGWKHSVYRVGGEVHVVFPGFSFPDAYEPQQADLLLRLPAGYPNANPDMYWTRQDVKLKGSGSWPAAAEHHEIPGSGAGAEVYAGKTWQRWSRHLQEGWRPGVDGLRTYTASVIRDLERRR